MSKPIIWVADDHDDQRTAIIASLVPARAPLMDETRMKWVEKFFSICEFPSARMVEEALARCTPETFPDLLISDNDFSSAKANDPDDRSADRGLRLLEWVRGAYPEIPVMLATRFSVNPYLERLIKLTNSAPLDFANSVYGIEKGKLDGEIRLNEAVQTIALRKLALLADDARRRLREMLDSPAPLDVVLAQSVHIEGKTYSLKHLLAGWIELVATEHRVVAAQFRESDLRQALSNLLPPVAALPAGLRGQLAGYWPGRLNRYAEADIAELARRVKAQLLEAQGPIIDELRPEVEKAIRVFLQINPAWTQPMPPQTLDLKRQRALLPSSAGVAELAVLQAAGQRSNLTFLPGNSPAEVRTIWKNILRARLTIVALYALQKRGTLLVGLPFSLDFAIHVLLRDKPAAFLQILYWRYGGMEHLPEMNFAKTGRQPSPDPRTTTRAYFNILCGLSGRYSDLAGKADSPASNRSETIHTDSSLYADERQWYAEILQGQRLDLTAG